MGIGCLKTQPRGTYLPIQTWDSKKFTESLIRLRKRIGIFKMLRVLVKYVRHSISGLYFSRSLTEIEGKGRSIVHHLLKRREILHTETKFTTQFTPSKIFINISRLSKNVLYWINLVKINNLFIILRFLV